MKFLIEFKLILMATHRRKTSIPYEEYLKIRNQEYPEVAKEFNAILGMPEPIQEDQSTPLQPKKRPSPEQQEPSAKRTPLGPGHPPHYNRDSPTVRSNRDAELQESFQRVIPDNSPEPVVDNAPVDVQPSTAHFNGNHPVGVYGPDHPLGIQVAVPEQNP